MMTDTLRLLFPEWQAGNKSAYYGGSLLLQGLLPKGIAHKERTVPVRQPSGAPLPTENGVVGQSEIADNLRQAKRIIDEESPRRIITLGGNCIVSQPAFDYLHGVYGDTLGIIWIDAHPDISSPAMFSHEHAMVWANLMKKGDEIIQAQVEHPFTAQDIFYVGLQPLTAAEEVRLKELDMPYAVVGCQLPSVADIRTWMERNGYTRLAIHWDLDVLNPDSFHSLYFNEPSAPRFAEASCGIYEPEEITELIMAMQTMADVVGLTIAEYLPWDALRLQRALASLEICRR